MAQIFPGQPLCFLQNQGCAGRKIQAEIISIGILFLVVNGEMFLVRYQPVMTAVLRCITGKYNAVFSGGRIKAVIHKRFLGMNVECQDKTGAFKD